MRGARLGFRSVLWFGMVPGLLALSGCGDGVTPATSPVVGQDGGGDPDPGPPPLDSDPGPPPFDPDPGPPPVEDDPPAPMPTRPTPNVSSKPKPVVPAPPPGKAFRIETDQGRNRAVVAAGVVLDSKLMSALAGAGGLHEVDVVATDAALLKVVPVIRRFPQVKVRFACGEWEPGRVTLNERATGEDLRAVASMREVRRLDLAACRVGDAELVELDRMVGLESLALPPATSDGIAPTLVRMRSLRDLSLEATRVTAAGLATLPRGLKSLNLSGTSIGDAGVEHLRRLPGLEQLWLDETSVGDRTLSVVSTRTTIEVLGLTGTAVTSEGLKHLAGLKKLTSLYLGETSIDDRALGLLIAMNQLKMLDVTATDLSVAARQQLVDALRTCDVQVDLDALVKALDDSGGRMDEALSRIARVTRNPSGEVKSLNIFDRNFSDTGMGILPRFTSLTRLSIGGTAVTNAGLKHLASMNQLEELWLNDTAISDPGLDDLRPLRALKQLHLRGTRATVSGVLNLWPALTRVRMSFPGGHLSPGSLALDRQAGPLELIPLEGLRGLRHLRLEGIRPGDAGLEHIRGLVELETLRLRRGGIRGPGLVHLHNMGGLQVLDLTGNRLDRVTNDSIAAWVELSELILDHTDIKTLAPIVTGGRPSLRRLSLAGTPVDDEQLVLLSKLTGLELLDLSGCPVTDQGIAAQLPGLPNLQALALRGTSVSDVAVGKLAACSTLRILWLSDTAVTSQGLSPLARLPQLARLDLSGCDVDAITLAAVGRFGKLARLDLRRTALPPTEVARWRELHAECEVVHAVDPLLEALSGGAGKTAVMLDAAVRQVAEIKESDRQGVEVTVTDRDLTDVGLARLSALKGLSRLVLTDVAVTDAGLGPLAASSTLRALDLSGTAITDHASNNLSRLGNLTELSLADTAFSDRGLSRLEGLGKLVSLDLAGLSISIDGLVVALPKLTSLQHLNLSQTWIVTADLRVLAKVRNLRSLAIRDTVIGDKGIALIAKLKSLKRLWIERTRITKTGLEELQKALPECEIFGP